MRRAGKPGWEFESLEMMDQPVGEADERDEESRGVAQESAPRRNGKPEIPPSKLQPVLEGLLFVGVQPVRPEHIAETYANVTCDDVERCLMVLSHQYQSQQRPYRLRRFRNQYRLELLPEHVRAIKASTQTEKSVRLPRAVIEVLSVVAYRQPISRTAIDDLLGTESAAALRQLVRRRLIQMDPDVTDDYGKNCYVTTQRFLDVFGIEDVGDLPAIEDLQF